LLKKLATKESDSLVWIGMLYLTIPLVMFVSLWTILPFALLSTVFLVLVFTITFPRFHVQKRSSGLNRNELIVSTLTAGMWTFSSGVWTGPFGRAGDWWDARDDILSTLTSHAWPVTHLFQSNDHPATIRHYLSFYLPGSAVGKLFGGNLSFTLFATGLWMMLGVGLVFYLVLRNMRFLGKRRYLVIPVFIFFSGLDIIGGRINGIVGLRPQYILNGGHIEWWVPEFQYSSFTTALHWVPHHAISGWLGTMIVLRIFEQKKHYAFLPLLVAAMFLWSTFTAVGVALVIAMQAILNLRLKEILAEVRRILPSIILSAITVLLLSMYLLAGTSDIAKFPIFSQSAYNAFGFDGPSQILRDYLLFIGLEVGIYLVLLFFMLRRHRRELTIVALVLCLIPLYRISVTNDWVMRTSIPPLLLLMLLIARGLLQPSNSRNSLFLRVCLVVVFLVGSATPLYEFFARYHSDYRSLEAPCVDSGCESQVAGYENRNLFWSNDIPFFLKTDK
jgi:hypothetical protein